MTVQYRFSSLAELADYMEKRAENIRASAETPIDTRKGFTKTRQSILRAEASAYENAAYTIRNCEITGRE